MRRIGVSTARPSPRTNPARFVGTRSFGKGVAQSIFDYPDGGQLYMVAYELRDANGVSWHTVGLVPDVASDLDPAKLIAGEDSQLTAAIGALAGVTVPPATAAGTGSVAPAATAPATPLRPEDFRRLIASGTPDTGPGRD